MYKTGWRILSVMACICLMYAGTAFGYSKGLKEQRKSVISTFDSVDTELNSRIGQANNLYTVASRYMDESEPEMIDLKTAIENLQSASDISEKAVYNKQLDTACNELEVQLLTLSLTDRERDAQYVEEILRELSASNKRISHLEYCENAQKWNETLKALPAKIFALPWLREPLDTFQIY